MTITRAQSQPSRPLAVDCFDRDGPARTDVGEGCDRLADPQLMSVWRSRRTIREEVSRDATFRAWPPRHGGGRGGRTRRAIDALHFHVQKPRRTRGEQRYRRHSRLGNFGDEPMVDVLEDVVRLMVMRAAQDWIRADAANDVPERLVVRGGVSALVVERVVGDEVGELNGCCVLDIANA